MRAYWTIDEAAEYVGLHKVSVYRLLKKGKFPGRKIGRDWKFKQSELDTWFDGEK